MPSHALTLRSRCANSHSVASKTRMAGLRADEKTLAAWARKAKAAGMSFNKWAHLILDSAPEVKPAAVNFPKTGDRA